ncbi:DUF7473 family protein [Natronomonas sp. EA1]|uniref:DUF7473 family protein n=1 Tax=Natronomonas sp. EA1 TaxID=3421655 RepID=UPI003EBC4799
MLAQVDATGGGLLALVVTFLVTTLFYAVTLHLAALFFIGEVPSQRAATVAPVPAAVSILLQQYGIAAAPGVLAGYGVAVALVMTFIADMLAISVVYRLKLKSAFPLTIIHLAFAAGLGFSLANLLGLL